MIDKSEWPSKHWWINLSLCFAWLVILLFAGLPVFGMLVYGTMAIRKDSRNGGEDPGFFRTFAGYALFVFFLKFLKSGL